MSSRESYHTCNTLVEIAKKLNYKLSILPETIEETQNLLWRHSEYFDKSTFISLVDEQSIYANCHRQGLSGIDLERRATNLKMDLFDLGIFESTGIVNNKENTYKRIYISSLTNDSPERYANLIRGHWGIENNLGDTPPHWHLDLTYSEDNSRVRNDDGLMNLNIFRKFGLFLLTHEPSKISLKRKRKKASRDDDFMIEILKIT